VHHTSRSRYPPSSGKATLEEARLNEELVLAAALDYAAAGRPVFPLSWNRTVIASCPACKPGGRCLGQDRCRCGVDTCHGFWAATTDAERITRWFIQHPDWQLGLRTGAPSGLVVLDVDLDKGGLNSLIALQHAGLDISGTAVQLSGSGQSLHLLFAHPGVPVRCSQGGTTSGLGPGLDVRGDGGYFVWVPSRHPSTGARYELLGSLLDLPVWPAPRPLQGAEVAAASPAGTSRPQRLLPTADGRPCSAVQEVLAGWLTALSEEPHHGDVLAPVLRLLRLRQQGHVGVAHALVQAEDAFVQAMGTRRSEAQAHEEFQRSIQGAKGAMTAPVEPKQHAACTCELSRLRQQLEAGEGLSTGTARNTEIKVLRHLLMRAEQRRSWLIEGESQRTIAVSIDIHQPTVSKALTRLHTAGVLIKMPSENTRNSRNTRNSPGYLLRAAKEVSIEETKTAGLPIDNPARAAVHPLFGAGGLGAGPADTFAMLSELSRPVLRGRLIRTRQGSKASALLADPYLTVRQIPRPEPGQGLTVAQLADQRGRSTSTLRNHLKVLRRVGLAFQVEGRWWRTRFDPEAVVAELQINDTAELKQLTYLRQRRQWWEAKAELVDSEDQPLFVKVLEEGHVAFVDACTGVVAWRDPQPEVHSAPDAPA